MIGYKVFTHDLRSPIQGGEPVWDGRTPHQLPRVECDQSDEDCAAGWNFCTTGGVALRIAGLWPNGRPSRLYRVEAVDAEVITRNDKCRAPSLTVIQEVVDVQFAIEELSAAFDARFRLEMVNEQMAWRSALARPGRDEGSVEEQLTSALEARGLGWCLRRFDSIRDASDAWAAWVARAAWATMAVRAASDTWAAWDARAASDTWAAWDARAAWAAGAAWATMAVRDARAALSHLYASRMGWVETAAANKLTIGIRDAYQAGLGMAIPVGDGVLGWAMDEAR